MKQIRYEKETLETELEELTQQKNSYAAKFTLHEK